MSPCRLTYRRKLLIGLFTAYVCLAGISTLLSPDIAEANSNHSKIKKYALLIGCTDYDTATLKDLAGPANDIALVAKSLHEDFAFPKERITVLLKSADKSSKPPTFDNIASAFAGLVKKAGPNTQIVIHLSGHGVQTPLPPGQEDPLDPANPEHDGMDEVFLPVDVKSWDPDRGIQNVIRDDQIAQWTGAMRKKGANVWIVFDCCHSGTMLREVNEKSVEIPRQVKLSDLGIPEEEIKEAQKRASEAVKKAGLAGEASRGAGDAYPDILNLQKTESETGSIVAFYAAQSFETAPELPRPKGAARVPENYYGMLTYTLVSSLKQHRKKKLTYRELAQIVVGRYNAERGYSAPSPYCEGDLDQEVLGLKQWPDRSSMLLVKEENTLKLNAGELLGITKGSVLSVHPPASRPGGLKKTLGYVGVKSVTPGESAVVPCAKPGDKNSKVIAAKEIANQSRCKLVFRDFGDLRFKVAIQAQPKTKSQGAVKAAVKGIKGDIANLFQLVDDPADADWILWVAEERVSWRPGIGAAIDAAKGLDAGPVSTSYGDYPISTVPKLCQQLEEDVQTIFTWNNVWRISGAIGNGQAGSNEYDLKLEVMKLKKDRTPDGPLTNGTCLRPGDRISWIVRNGGYYNLWVYVLYVDGNFGIRVKELPPLESGKHYGPVTLRMTDAATGKEGMIVLAFSKNLYKTRPNLNVLNQPGLAPDAETSRDGKLQRAHETPKTPFGSLLNAAAVGKGQSRFPVEEEEPSNPAILSCSWITLKAGPSENSK